MACSAITPDTRLSEACSSKLIELAKYNVRLTRPKAIQRTMIRVEARWRAGTRAKSEGRNPTRCDGATARREAEGNPKPEGRIRNSEFGLLSVFGFRFSGFIATDSSATGRSAGTSVQSDPFSGFPRSGRPKAAG